MNTPQIKQWANVYISLNYLMFVTKSGFRMNAIDPLFNSVILDMKSNKKEMGIALNSVLKQSRFLDIAEVNDFFSPPTIKESYENKIKSFMAQSGYVNRLKFFKEMNLCSIEKSGDAISICLLKKDKGEGWGNSAFEKILKEPVSFDELGEVLVDCIHRIKKNRSSIDFGLYNQS